MKIRLYHSAKRTFLTQRLMWLGMLLACFAWVMQLSPLFAPLWLDNVTAGHGLCIKLAPLMQAGSPVNQTITSTQNLASFYNHSAHQPSPTNTTDAVAPSAIPNDLNPDNAHLHECDICLALLAFSLPTFDFKLIGSLVLAYIISVQVIYRSLSQRFIAFLRPPSRASPCCSLCLNG